MRYYKGHSAIDGRQMIFKLYDKPRTDMFGKSYIIEASAIEKTGITKYGTLNDCDKENYLQREITESEYNCYSLIQRLTTEIFNHSFTGGFPREETLLNISRKLPVEIKTLLSEIGENI